jgi:hypothetical protein
MDYIIAAVVRLVWSLTIGLVFFALGTVLFVLLDIFMPQSDRSYKCLNLLYKWGSCHWFNRIRFGLETDDFDVVVEKRRPGGAKK